jgi:hypothetical protein
VGSSLIREVPFSSEDSTSLSMREVPIEEVPMREVPSSECPGVRGED